MLQKRIKDKSLLRLIGKWLRVGVIEDGRLLTSENGTYQGSVISPLLANVYLHHVLDLWVEEVVKPRMRGEISLHRFADDFVVCFQYRSDALKFQRVLPKRFAKYGLTLHPDKTRLIRFGRFASKDCWRLDDRRKPNAFSFLGFTFYCGRSREGKFVVKQKTMSKRLRRSLLRAAEWCRMNRHRPLQEQQKRLTAILEGHYQYYGLRNNYRSLKLFYRGVTVHWRKWLGRRGSTAVPCREFYRLLKRYPLPSPRITQGARWNQLELSGEFN
jgi:hypothetical protein